MGSYCGGTTDSALTPVQPGHYSLRHACPDGYSMLLEGESVFCAATIETPGSWSSQQAACSPYSLATVESAAQHELVNGLRQHPFNSYWYARWRATCIGVSSA